MVRLRSLEPPGVQIHAKLEWFNPGGSVKDRAALRMVQEAVSTLRGRTLLDSTSGNTGIAYAWIGAALHIPVALVMPGNVSEARRRIARHFGARIIFSDALEQSDGAIRLARKISIATDLGWDMAERLIRDEGLLAGHSAGAAAAGALQVAHELAGRGERGVVVTLFPDRADRYISPP